MLVVVVIAVLIAAAAVAAPRLGVPSALLLTGAGAAIASVPGSPEIAIEPDIVLHTVLPMVLYSAATRTPLAALRREMTAITGLAVLLVVATALVTGLVLHALGVPLLWAIALGAVLSPTDAAAIGIARAAGMRRRVRAVLEAETLLNDATALIALRIAVVAATTTASVGVTAAWTAGAIVLSLLIGLVGGWVSVQVRARMPVASASTLLGLIVPIAVAYPSEAIGGSGVLAAVVAGLMVGSRELKIVPARHRLGDRSVWRVVEAALEGTIFLVMGSQLPAILTAPDVLPALGVSAIALVTVLAVRAAVMYGLVGTLRFGVRTKTATFPALRDAHEALLVASATGPGSRRVGRLVLGTRRAIADTRFFLANPLGPADGAALTWVGMRGIVTVAAVQTLPPEAPGRDALVAVAYIVTAMSLLLQGATLRPLVRLLTRGATPVHGGDDLLLRIDSSSSTAALLAQRSRLLEAHDDGSLPLHEVQRAIDRVDALLIASEHDG